jgi:cytochrome c
MQLKIHTLKNLENLSMLEMTFKRVAKISLLFSLMLIAGTAFSQIQQEKPPAVFDVCSTCHSLNADDNGTGPTLHKLMGRKSGSVEGFRYSRPLKRSQLIWDQNSLYEFLTNPQGKIPGNRMPYSGLSDEKELKVLMEFLSQATQ